MWDRHIKTDRQTNAIEYRSPEINPLWSNNLLQECEDHSMGKRQSFQQMMLRKLTDTCKRIKLDFYLTLHIKINPKWIKVLNVRPKAIKLTEKNIRLKFYNIEFVTDFWYMTPKAQVVKAKQTCMAISNFCT